MEGLSVWGPGKRRLNVWGSNKERLNAKVQVVERLDVWDLGKGRLSVWGSREGSILRFREGYIVWGSGNLRVRCLGFRRRKVKCLGFK